MSIAASFIHSLTVYRMSGGTNRKEYAGSPTATLPCFIQPIDDQNEVIDGMAYGKTFRAFVDYGADIKGSDKAVDQDSTEYRVAGVKWFNYGDNKHGVVLLTVEG